MRLTIKSRVLLLALVVLAGLLSVSYLHYRSSEDELDLRAELIELLAQTDLIARAVHELQRERGLTSSYLASRDLRLLEDLQAQYRQTAQRLRELHAASTRPAPEVLDLEPFRRKVAAHAPSPTESFLYYTERIANVLAGADGLSAPVADRQTQQEVAAQMHLIQAKEFLAQARATLMAGTPAEPGWQASLGERTGLFEWHYSRFRQFSSTPPADSAELAEARRVLAAARKDQSTQLTVRQRMEWYRGLTEAIDRLHTLERGALAALTSQVKIARVERRLKLHLERAGLLAAIALLAYLAFSSLRLILNALEASLIAARRAASGTPEGRSTNRGDEVGEIARGVGGLLDLVDQLNRKASTDPLTGAFNRQGFAEIAQGELERARRYQRRLAMIMFDLDHFKLINDQFGHASGDAVLRAMAGLVHENLRLADVFARWGGEEFIILAPESTEEDAAQLADKLRTLFRELRAPRLPTFTASFGVTAFLPEDSLESLFERADRALYAAKVGGRDQVVAYDAEAQAVQLAEKPGRRRLTVIRNPTPKRTRKT